MDFRPVILSSSIDYSMHFDITMEEGEGITEMWITDDGINAVNDVNDLHYDLVSRRLVSRVNLVTPGGSCPEDGSILYLLIVMCLGLALPRSGKALNI